MDELLAKRLRRAGCVALWALLPLLQGCYPVVTYSQSYQSTQQHFLTPEGDSNAFRMRVEPHVSKNAIFVFLRPDRVGSSPPRVEIPCQLARFKTTGAETSEPIASSTFYSPSCTDAIRLPRKTALYSEDYEVNIAFKNPGRISSVITHSMTEAIGEKTKSAFGQYRDWFEISLPPMKVEGAPSHLPATPRVLRFERTVRETWRIEWFVPVSKG